jgi:hypothetical protein
VNWNTGEDGRGDLIVLSLTGAETGLKGNNPPPPSTPLSCIAEGRGIHNENFQSVKIEINMKLHEALLRD